MKSEAQQYKRVKVVFTTSKGDRRLLERFLRSFFVLPILAYQYFVAPLTANCCRFHPCCSIYAREAITKYGIAKGIRLSIKRLTHCHPWGGNGYDPVP